MSVFLWHQNENINDLCRQTKRYRLEHSKTHENEYSPWSLKSPSREPCRRDTSSHQECRSWRKLQKSLLHGIQKMHNNYAPESPSAARSYTQHPWFLATRCLQTPCNLTPCLHVNSIFIIPHIQLTMPTCASYILKLSGCFTLCVFHWYLCSGFQNAASNKRF